MTSAKARRLVLARIAATREQGDTSDRRVAALDATTGLATPVDTWGPPPLARITDTFFEMSATDIDARMRDEEGVDPRPLVRAHELRLGGPVVKDGNLEVTAAIVDHPPWRWHLPIGSTRQTARCSRTWYRLRIQLSLTRCGSRRRVAIFTDA